MAQRNSNKKFSLSCNQLAARGIDAMLHSGMPLLFSSTICLATDDTKRRAGGPSGLEGRVSNSKT